MPGRTASSTTPTTCAWSRRASISREVARRPEPPRSGDVDENGLCLEVRVEVGVTHLAPDPRLLEAAERGSGVGWAPDVHVHLTSPQQSRELVGRGDVPRPDAG